MTLQTLLSLIPLYPLSSPGFRDKSNPLLYQIWHGSKVRLFHEVGPARLERATPCLEGRCSIQLSYGPEALRRPRSLARNTWWAAPHPRHINPTNVGVAICPSLLLPNRVQVNKFSVMTCCDTRLTLPHSLDSTFPFLACLRKRNCTNAMGHV